MSNSINTSNAPRTVPTKKESFNGKQVQPFKSESFTRLLQLIEKKFKKMEPSFKQLEQKVESYLKNHKNLFQLIEEEQSLSGKDPNQFSEQQISDMKELKGCLMMLQECSKILTAVDKYIDGLKRLMDKIAQGVYVQSPEQYLNLVFQNEGKLIPPQVPGTGTTSKL